MPQTKPRGVWRCQHDRCPTDKRYREHALKVNLPLARPDNVYKNGFPNFHTARANKRKTATTETEQQQQSQLQLR